MPRPIRMLGKSVSLKKVEPQMGESCVFAQPQPQPASELRPALSYSLDFSDELMKDLR
ncbi:MAG: hypothetical protein JW395_1315 [Nitrospira sp.]|nr:hypothetical protein [Nitrospira sp.]